MGTEYESDLIMKYKLFIQDGKIVKVEINFKDGIDHSEVFVEAKISYNPEDVNYVDLPTNIDWQ